MTNGMCECDKDKGLTCYTCLIRDLTRRLEVLEGKEDLSNGWMWGRDNTCSRPVWRLINKDGYAQASVWVQDDGRFTWTASNRNSTMQTGEESTRAGAMKLAYMHLRTKGDRSLPVRCAYIPGYNEAMEEPANKWEGWNPDQPSSPPPVLRPGIDEGPWEWREDHVGIWRLYNAQGVPVARVSPHHRKEGAISYEVRKNVVCIHTSGVIDRGNLTMSLTDARVQCVKTLIKEGWFRPKPPAPRGIPLVYYLKREITEYDPTTRHATIDSIETVEVPAADVEAAAQVDKRGPRSCCQKAVQDERAKWVKARAENYLHKSDLWAALFAYFNKYDPEDIRGEVRCSLDMSGPEGYFSGALWQLLKLMSGGVGHAGWVRRDEVLQAIRYHFKPKQAVGDGLSIDQLADELERWQGECGTPADEAFRALLGVLDVLGLLPEDNKR